MALARRFRLKRKDIKRVFKSSRRFSSVISVFVLKNNGLLFSRFGFGVPVLAAKKSNKRNRIRRMAAEWTRLHYGGFAGGFDVMVIFKKEALNLAKKDFYKQLKAIFIKTGIFKE